MLTQSGSTARRRSRIRETGWHGWLWLAISASFTLAALFHAHAAATYTLPIWRHVLFAVINLGVAWGCWRQPRWFIWVFGLLLLQQLYSHGLDLARAWPERIDWSSVVVLLGMPLVALALWRERTT